jgi:hypothetical protein
MAVKHIMLNFVYVCTHFIHRLGGEPGGKQIRFLSAFHPEERSRTIFQNTMRLQCILLYSVL